MLNMPKGQYTVNLKNSFGHHKTGGNRGRPFKIVILTYSPVIMPWPYRKERLISWAYTRAWELFWSYAYTWSQMLSFGQSSSKYLKTEISQMLAIIYLQDQSYWYPYSINIHAETKHYTHVVGLTTVKSTRAGNCNKDMSLAVSTFTQH